MPLHYRNEPIKKFLKFIGRLLPARQFHRLWYPYRKPKRLINILDDNFFMPVSVTSDSENEEVKENPIFKIWREIPGAHKWVQYFNTYQTAIAHFDERPIRMLEIGVYKGGSLKMWRKYLGSESLIVGIDIDPSCQQFEKIEEKTFVRIGDQSDQEFLNKLIQEFGPFDLIIDDGSHISSHMITTFNSLFLCGLKDGGIYMAEDTHTSFWPKYRDMSYSFLDLSKDLVDLMHAYYWDRHSEVYFRKDHIKRVEKLLVPRICSEISKINFTDSIVTIYKNKKKKIPVCIHL